MPLPLILGIGAAIAGVTGVGSGVYGAAKMKEANDTMKGAEARHKANIEHFEMKNRQTTEMMDELGTKEMEILKSFEKFADMISRIQGRPRFKSYDKNGVIIPEYNAEELEKVSVGAGILLSGMGGAALGTAGGFAAAGATTAAVMALGTASTGTAIASLGGAAATNATLAALGGGALAAGGGGVALGTTVLGAATLGVGLLVGGVIFSIAGSSISDKADKAWEQMRAAEREINKSCVYLDELEETAKGYLDAITKVNRIYDKYMSKLADIVCVEQRTVWQEYTDQEKKIVENTVLLVSLLYEMNKVQLVLKEENDGELNEINRKDVGDLMNKADTVLSENGWELI